MKFQFTNLPSVEANVVYDATITNVSIIDEDTEKERVLVNVSVNGFMAPRPASYNTTNDTGSRMLNELLVALGYTEECSIADFLKSKSVKIRCKENAGYMNTTIYAPTQKIETTEPIF